MDIIHSSYPASDIAPQAIDESTATGVGFLVRGQRWVTSRIHVAGLGASQTLAVKLQKRTGPSSWEDVEGAVTEGLGRGDLLQSEVSGSGLLEGTLDLDRVPGIYGFAPMLRHVITSTGAGEVSVAAHADLAGAHNVSVSYGAEAQPRLWEVGVGEEIELGAPDDPTPPAEPGSLLALEDGTSVLLLENGIDGLLTEAG